MWKKLKFVEIKRKARYCYFRDAICSKSLSTVVSEVNAQVNLIAKCYLCFRFKRVCEGSGVSLKTE